MNLKRVIVLAIGAVGGMTITAGVIYEFGVGWGLIVAGAALVAMSVDLIRDDIE